MKLTSRLHIVIVNQHPADLVGGSEIQCDIIARGLVQRGHRVDYLAVEGKDTQNYQTPYGVCPVVRSAEAIASSIITLKPHVVYWRFNKHCFAQAAEKIRRAGIPLVFSVSHVRDVSRFYLQPGSWRNGGLKGLRRALKEGWHLYREHRGFAYVDALVSNNTDNLGKLALPIQLHIPNSMVNTAKSFHWPRPYCLWVSNIKERKQPERFIELAVRLRDTGVDFLMVGQLQGKSYAPMLAAGPENFYYLGEKSLYEVNGMVAGSLFLAHTCYPEGFSNIFIQAWLQGRPVVSLAFDPGGLLGSEGLGFFADGAMDTFVEQTRQLIANPAQAIAMGKRARAYAEVQFSPEANIDQLESLLMSVVHPRLAP